MLTGTSPERSNARTAFMSFGLNLRGRPVVRKNSIMLGAAAFLQSVDRPQTPVCSGLHRDFAAYRAAAHGSSTRISTFDAPADRAALRLASTTAGASSWR